MTTGISHPSEQRPLTGGPGSGQGPGIRGRTALSAGSAFALIVFGGAVGLLSFGQDSGPSAKELAARVDKHYNELRSLKATFTEKYQGLGIVRAEGGTLLLAKPGRMKWEYSSPPGKLFVLDGRFAWFYASGDPQVQRVPAKELDDLRSPLRLLLGHTELEKEMTHLTVAAGAGSTFTLTGQPKGEENRVARLTLTVNGDGAISEIEIQETDGALTDFTFTDQQPNIEIPPVTFHFTPPVGVPIVNAPPPV